MAAGFWALINRALTVDARSLRPHLYRLIFVGVNCLSVLWCEATSMIFGAPGLRLFQSIAHIDMLLLTIAGFSLFATVISEEKEDRLIGLLKMTGVSHVGLILGKSTSRMISVLMLLVVQLPFTLFAVTLGGILMHQMLAAYLALFAYLVLVANLGLFCSIVSPTARSAAGLAGVLLVFYFTLPSIAWALIGMVPGGTAVFWDNAIEFTAQTSVVYRLNETMTTGFIDSPWSVQVWTNLAAGGVFFVVSWLLFDACTQGDDGAGAMGLLSLWKRTTRRSRPCWDAALVWKDFQFVTGGAYMLLVKSFFILLLIIAAVVLNSPGRLQDVGSIVLIVICPILIIESALYASRVFRDELQHKTWSTLLMLPRSTRDVAAGKLLGCVLALMPGAVLLFVGILLSSGIEGIAQVMFGPWLWYSLMPLLVFTCLTAWLSIHLKWGALPAALVITLFTHQCVLSPLLLISLMIIGLGTGQGFGQPPTDYLVGIMTSLGFASLSVAIFYGFSVFIVRDLESAGER